MVSHKSHPHDYDTVKHQLVAFPLKPLERCW